MARPRKVIRTKTLYKRHRFPKKAATRILFFLIILVLIGVGFLIMREWSARFGKDAPKQNSSVTESSSLPSSEAVSSETPSSTPQKPKPTLGNTAFLEAELLMTDISAFKDSLARLRDEGYTSVTLELKPISGILPYKSAVLQATEYGLIDERASLDLNQLVAAIKEAGLLPAANISAFKDQNAAHVSRDNSFAYADQLKTNWLDNSLANGGKAWLNPYMENARKYICDITAEISRAGFEIITVQNIMFPDKNTGKMNTILTNPSREEILNQAFEEIKSSAPDSEVLREPVAENPPLSSSSSQVQAE